MDHYNHMNINMTAAIQQAVFENNEGTRLVRQCQYDSAVKSFTSVLKILKPLAAILEDNNRFEGGDNEDDTEDDTETDTDTDAYAYVDADTSSVPFKISFTDNNNNSMEDDASEDDSNDTMTRRTTAETSSSPTDDSKETLNDCSSSASSSSSASAVKLIATKHNCKEASTATTKSFARKPKYFVFRDPVVIPPESLPSRAATTKMTIDDTETDDDNDDDSSLYSSEFFSKFLMIVMYNLALTLHLHALSLSSTMSSSSSSSSIKHVKKLFLRSKKLYELAFEMHLDADVDLLFTLALINNLGLIYQTVNEKVRSKTCFKNMFSTMMYLMDSNESQSIKEWDGLLSNAMDILKIGNEVAAPAA